MKTEPEVDSKQSYEVQELQKRDIALYFKEEGDENFNPDRNKWIIAQTIKKNEENRKKILRQEADNLGERVDAVVSFIYSRMAQSSSLVEKYFGKRYLAHLRGMKIANVLKTGLQNRQRQVYLPK